MSMKAKLGQPPSQNKTFVPAAPAKAPSAPANQAPTAPTK